MKHWVESTNIDKQKCLYLKDNDRVIAVSVDDNRVTFTEACDEWFSTTLSKEEAIEALEELIEYIRWEEKNKPKDTVVVYTGIEGKVNHQEQLVKYVGGTFTEEDRDKYRQELINSGQTIFKL